MIQSRLRARRETQGSAIGWKIPPCRSTEAPVAQGHLPMKKSWTNDWTSCEINGCPFIGWLTFLNESLVTSKTWVSISPVAVHHLAQAIKLPDAQMWATIKTWYEYMGHGHPSHDEYPMGRNSIKILKQWKHSIPKCGKCTLSFDLGTCSSSSI
jgi:hypothetical protein